MVSGVIYRITNQIDGKIYIGQTTSTGIQFDKYFGSGTLIKRAIQLHGLQNFQKDILIKCNTQKALDLMEQYFIKKYKSCNRKIGYNILQGSSNKFGQGSPMLLPEVVKKVSESKRGKSNGREGCLHSQQTKSILSKKALDRIKNRPELLEIMSLNARIQNHLQGNSMKNRVRITNGLENKTIKNDEAVPVGYWRGFILGLPRQRQRYGKNISH